MNDPVGGQWGQSRARRTSGRVNSIFLESGTCRVSFWENQCFRFNSQKTRGFQILDSAWLYAHNSTVKHLKLIDLGELYEGCSLETEHKSGQRKVFPSPLSNAPCSCTHFIQGRAICLPRRRGPQENSEINTFTHHAQSIFSRCDIYCTFHLNRLSSFHLYLHE